MSLFNGLHFKFCLIPFLVLLQFIYIVNGKGVDIGRMHSFMHGIKGFVSILDEKTIEIIGMTYDGEGPGSWFVVGHGDDYVKEFVDLDAIVIPDENNECSQLRRYSGETIKLTFPGKVSDYDYLAIYCLKFNHNFGYIGIRSDVKIPPIKKNSKHNEVEACENVDTSDAVQNRRPTCQPWPSCWNKPSDQDEEESYEDDRK